MAKGRKKRAPGTPALSSGPKVAVWWKVAYATGWTLVEAGSEDQAREKFQQSLPSHQRNKPWLIRDLTFRPSTEADRQAFAAMTGATALTRQKLGLPASATPKGYAQ